MTDPKHEITMWYHTTDGYQFQVKEDAEKHIEEMKIKEAHSRDRWLYCPNCDAKLEITKDLSESYKELFSRIFEVKRNITRIQHRVRYEITADRYPDGLTAVQVRDTLKQILKEFGDIAKGTATVQYSGLGGGLYLDNRRKPYAVADLNETTEGASK